MILSTDGEPDASRAGKRGFQLDRRQSRKNPPAEKSPYYRILPIRALRPRQAINQIATSRHPTAHSLPTPLP
jgi:hypothetical protein